MKLTVLLSLLLFTVQVSADNSALFKVQENQLAQFKLQQEQALAYFEMQQQVQQELIEYQLAQAQLQQLQLVIQQQKLSYTDQVQVVQQKLVQQQQQQPVKTTNNDLAILNRARVRRNLPPYKYDRNLTDIAYERASRQARNRRMSHVSGKPSGVAEGVSRNGSSRGGNPIAIACLSMSRNYRTAGASCVKGRDGRTYCSLILKR